jgi:hypothetical protein
MYALQSFLPDLVVPDILAIAVSHRQIQSEGALVGTFWQYGASAGVPGDLLQQDTTTGMWSAQFHGLQTFQMRITAVPAPSSLLAIACVVPYVSRRRRD